MDYLDGTTEKPRRSKGGERMVWSGRSSQILNLGFFSVCLLFSWLAVPVLLGLWKWLELRCRVYELTTERLRITSGVLSRRTDEIELYRVKDGAIDQPFFLRLFGLANVVLATSDRTHARIVIPAVRQAQDLWDDIRTHVEAARKRIGVRELDLSQ